MAEAVQSIFPDAKFGIGPAIGVFDAQRGYPVKAHAGVYHLPSLNLQQGIAFIR